jgi:hypothetical protein
VAPAADQFFEYKDCHERSGMLRAVTVTVTATADVVA